MNRFLVVAFLALGLGAALPPAQAQQITLDARDDRAFCSLNSSVTINVLANDTFEAGVTVITNVTDPAHGEVFQGQLPGQYTFVAEDGFLGTTSFNYTLTPLQGGTPDTATVTINVVDAANLLGGFITAEQICNADSNECSIDAIAAIANNGTLCGCSVAVQVFLSDDPVLDPKDRTIARFLTEPIGPDRVFEKRIIKRLKRGTNVSGDFLILKIDVTDRLREVNERDNLGNSVIGPKGRSCRNSPARLNDGQLIVECGDGTEVITRY
jgi:hypothetical protein